MKPSGRPLGIAPHHLWLVPIYTVLAHASRMVSALIIIKLISVYAGPSGLAQLGFFMSLASFIAVFAGGGIGNAVTKFVAEYQGSPIRIARFLGCALSYGGVFSLMLLALSLPFAPQLSEWMFDDSSFWWMMPIFGIAQVLAFIGVLTVSAVNGAGRQDLFAQITLVANFGTILVSYFLISNLGVKGGALALAISTASVGCISLFVIIRSGILRVLRPQVRSATMHQLFKFSLMMLSAATFFPITEILVRSQIIATLGLEVAGLWQGLFRLSGSYIGFFSVYLAAVFMPRLSGTHDLLIARNLVQQQMLRTGAAFLLCALAVYLFREQVVLLVFAPSFLPLTAVIAMQLLGDLFRVLSYIVGFLLVSKSAARLYIFAEFLQFSIYLGIMFWIVASGGDLESITMGYAISYGIYFAVTLAILFRFTRKN